MAVWSKAETHCVWCGKPDATNAEYERDHDDHSCDDACWCQQFCWTTCGDEAIAEDELLALRAKNEAQAAVLTRYRNGWWATQTGGRVGLWGRDNLRFEYWEPMTEAEQRAVYGEVVKP